MRKYVIGAVVGAILATTVSVYADDGLEKIEAYLRPGLPIILDGQPVKLESSPVMYDGSTYLKLRDVAKITGLNVEWNELDQRVELSSNGSKEQISGGETKMEAPTENLIQNPVEPKPTIDEINQGIETIKTRLAAEEWALRFAKERNHPAEVIAAIQANIDSYNAQIAELEAKKAELENK